MRVLVLGGTGFVGRHTTATALARGDDVTLFNRGSRPDLFPAARRLKGDRYAGDLAALRTGEWDVVVDVNGYLPRDVAASAGLLSGRAGRYVFVSTVAVYADVTEPGADESWPLEPLPPGAPDDELTAESYGPLKARCEQAASARFDGPVVVVRPGAVVGPHDPLRQDGFAYWVDAAGVDCPARPGQPVQVTDARMLAEFLLDAGAPGPHNAVGVPTTFEQLVADCRADVRWTAEGTAPFVVPPEQEPGFQLRPADGLRHRAMADTADWIRRSR